MDVLVEGRDDKEFFDAVIRPMLEEQFRSAMPKQFKDSVVNFMTEVLRRFRMDTAKSKNRSFCYLMDLLEARLRKA